MANEDYLIRGTLQGAGLRFVHCETTRTVASGIILHDADPVSGVIFGRALTVGALVTPLLKTEEKYTLRWEYDGAISSIIVDADAEGRLRGIPANPHLMGSGTARTERELYGTGGTIGVTRSQGGSILNSGVTAARLLDIADDVAFFFSTSDQVETEISVRMSLNPDPANPVGAAAGLMIQAMPGCDLEGFGRIRRSMKGKRFLDALIDRPGAPEEHLAGLLGMLDGIPKREAASLDLAAGLSLSRSAAPRYACNCSRSRMRDTIATLIRSGEGADGGGPDLFNEGNRAQVRCHFCNTTYAFTREELSFGAGSS